LSEAALAFSHLTSTVARSPRPPSARLAYAYVSRLAAWTRETQ